MEKQKIQRIPNWLIMFDSESEADELLEQQVPFKKAGTKIKRSKGKNVQVGVYFGELLTKFFDSHTGKWGVKGEGRFVDADMVKEMKKNMADTYLHYKELEKNYTPKEVKVKKKAGDELCSEQPA